MNEMSSPTPASPISPPPAEPRPRRRSPFHSRKALVASVLVGVLILLAVIAALPVGGDNLWHRIYAVIQLRNVQVAEGFTQTSQAYSFGITGLKPFAPNDTAVPTGDYASAGGTTAAVQMREGADAQVYLLGDDDRALTDYPGAKAIVDVSPEGNLVAFSVASSTDATKISSWEIHLYDLSKDTDVVLGTGIGAQFFERDGKVWLLYTTPEGLSVVDTATLKGFTTTTFEFLDNVGFIAKIAPDGQHIALRNSANNQFSLFEVYRLDSNVPMGIRPLPADLSGFADVVLTNGAFYGATLPSAEQEVDIHAVSYDAEGQGSALYSFPADTAYRFME